MNEERRPLDPTRKLLKIFGVKVTDYEERTAELLGRAAAEGTARPTTELLQLVEEVIELTANLSGHLREINAHVLEMQANVLSELKSALEKTQHS